MSTPVEQALTEVRKLATRRGLEPRTSAVTGRRSNQLNYRAVYGRVNALDYNNTSKSILQYLFEKKSKFFSILFQAR